jgi:hypothetical protein
VSAAFLYYDYIFTLPAEIQYIWRGKYSYMTLLFLGCRFGLVGNMIYLLTLFNVMDK